MLGLNELSPRSAERIGKAAALVILSSAVLQPCAAAQEAAVAVAPVLSTTSTAAGQPIRLPAKNVEVVVSTYDIARGAKLPVHKHPFARYAYVLTGTLRVTNGETGAATDYRAGQFIVEMLDTWHFGENVGNEPVRLVVIDQVEAGQSNTILQKAQ
jgi:quercetin dioxygenase-like cupin family protein